MFRHHIHTMRRANISTPSSLFVSSTVARGVTHTQLRRDFISEETVKPLPSPEMFSIEAYQRAGIELNKVPTQVLGGPNRDSNYDDQAEKLLNQLDENKTKPTE